YDYAAAFARARESIVARFFAADAATAVGLIALFRSFDLIAQDAYFEAVYRRYVEASSKAVEAEARNALIAANPERLKAAVEATLRDGAPKARLRAVEILALAL